MREYPETHQQGHISIENIPDYKLLIGLQDGDICKEILVFR